MNAARLCNTQGTHGSWRPTKRKVLRRMTTTSSHVGGAATLRLSDGAALPHQGVTQYLWRR